MAEALGFPEARLAGRIRQGLKGELPLPEETIRKIRRLLERHRTLPPSALDGEIRFFFVRLGFPRYYFTITPPEEIARTIEMLYALRILGADLPIASRRKNRDILIVPESEKNLKETGEKIERFVGEALEQGKFVEIDSHRTRGRLGGRYLNVIMVESGLPANGRMEKIGAVRRLLSRRFRQSVSPAELGAFFQKRSAVFIDKSYPDRIARYFLEYRKCRAGLYPPVCLSRTADRREHRIMVTFDGFYFKGTMSVLTDLFLRYGVRITRSYVTFSRDPDGCTAGITLYVPRETPVRTLEKLGKEIYLLVISPRTGLDGLQKHGFSPDGIFFINAFSEFAHQFLRTSDSVLDILREMIRENPELDYLFSEFRMKVEREMFDLKSIRSSLLGHPRLSRLLFCHFYEKFLPGKKRRRDLSGRLSALIDSSLKSETDRNIFQTGLRFVGSIRRTNFFKEPKAALGFKLSPDFLPAGDAGVRPYSVFYFYGKKFKGYHVRFQRISRGGVRIVPSRSAEEYLKNSDDNFLEVFNLAYTQEKKNKDIPEGGSKGILLPYYGETNTGLLFKNYIDAMLDLMLPGKETVTDYDRERDLIFLGPDEGSAPLMDWASLRAAVRGYPCWRAFTTGKSGGQGGISHREYGMTTAGVHEYVLQILSKLGLKEEEITKVQTGGPDGDLGGNEILVSRDRTIAVIDGSGAAYDPDGLDRRELVRLVRLKQPVSCFRPARLGKKGFVHSLEERNISALGRIFRTGAELRDLLPFLVRSDLFVPAGGRPRTVNISNWKEMLIREKEPRYKVIVEGANLFITQDARIKLEESGVLLIKDSSANKGGVTSSSLEVLSGMLLSGHGFEKCMCVKAGRAPEFRKRFIETILALIRKNAQREFSLLWNEKQSGRKPFSALSDRLSELVNRVTAVIRESDLVRDRSLALPYLRRHIPELLLKKISLEKAWRFLPSPYRDALVSRRMALEFLYGTGLSWLGDVMKTRRAREIDVIRAYLRATENMERMIKKKRIIDPEVREKLFSSRKELILQMLKMAEQRGAP